MQSKEIKTVATGLGYIFNFGSMHIYLVVSSACLLWAFISMKASVYCKLSHPLLLFEQTLRSEVVSRWLLAQSVVILMCWCSCNLSTCRFPMRVQALPQSEMQICTSVACQKPWRRKNWSSSSLSMGALLPRVSWWTRWLVSRTWQLPAFPPLFLFYIHVPPCFSLGTAEQNDTARTEKCIRGGDTKIPKMQFSTRGVHKYALKEYENGCKVAGLSASYLSLQFLVCRHLPPPFFHP